MAPHRVRRPWATVAIALVALALTACTAEPPSPPAAFRELPVPDRIEFEPGLIVSDDSFYNSTAMDAASVQEFLEAVPCRPDADVVCLADYTETTETVPAVGGAHCRAYRGGDEEPASRIIVETAKACGINPQTLLVLLQKEQSLLTHPNAYGYQRATGYGCPDSADCDADYFGFFNQVYNAAWQFRQYTEEPVRRYMIGAVDVQYHPDAECGASAVRIENQATANLYNYTPYQPNVATLGDANADDECGAYGNLNFWLIWNRWFGDPLAVRLPAFFPACERLVGGHACPSALPSLPGRR